MNALRIDGHVEDYTTKEYGQHGKSFGILTILHKQDAGSQREAMVPVEMKAWSDETKAACAKMPKGSYVIVEATYKTSQGKGQYEDRWFNELTFNKVLAGIQPEPAGEPFGEDMPF